MDPGNPGDLLYNTGAGRSRFNLVEAYNRSRRKPSNSGILVGIRAQKLLFTHTQMTYDPSTIVILQTENHYLWVIFPDSSSTKEWKTAVSSLIKHLKHSKPPVLPTSKRQLSPSMGLIFDITAIERTDDRLWTTLKTTFLRETESYEEYFLYDKSQLVLEQSCEEVLSSLRDRIDPGNLAILQTFLSEITLLEYEKRTTMKDFGAKTLQISQENELNGEEEMEIQAILKENEGNFEEIKRDIERGVNCLQLPQISPLKSLFDQTNLFLKSTELAISSFSQVKIESNSSKLVTKPVKKTRKRSETARLRHPKDIEGKWYRDACDCHLF